MKQSIYFPVKDLSIEQYEELIEKLRHQLKGYDGLMRNVGNNVCDHINIIIYEDDNSFDLYNLTNTDSFIEADKRDENMIVIVKELGDFYISNVGNVAFKMVKL